jgi:1,4-alpha-glucan branching enzyme
MMILPLSNLGASEPTPGTLTFGVFLPAIRPAIATSVSVQVVREADAMLQTIAPVTVPLAYSLDPTYGEYWSGTVTLSAVAAPAGSTWGASGTYLYWYQVVLTSGLVVDYLIDPFAREYGFADSSAITVGYTARPWSSGEAAWRTPALSDLIFMEVEPNEFGGGLAGSAALLPYLQKLGVTAVEVTPVTNVGKIVDWGYSPLGYFGIDNRFGNRADFQSFVDQAHACGMAVVVDMVYGHTDDRFLYHRLYDRAHLPNPLMGQGPYGPQPDYDQPLMRDLFYTASSFWLSTFHVDGFRYDNVEAMWDGTPGSGYYPALTEATYRLAAAAATAASPSPDWQRLADAGGAINLIQAAEYLTAPVTALQHTFSNCAWQNDTLGASISAASGASLYGLGMQSGLTGYPSSATVSEITLPKIGLQYIETHDHQRFVCNYGVHAVDKLQSAVLEQGNRLDGQDASGSPYAGHWFAAQPYLFVVLLGRGIPFLWQGQELGEHYYVPEDVNESGRIKLFRPVRWRLALDQAGSSLSRLVRQLIQIRKNGPQFRVGDHSFVNDYEKYQSKGLLLFTRSNGGKTSLVALNFTGSPQWSTYAFPTGGTYTEEVDGGTISGVVAGADTRIDVPSNYGRVWTSP